MVRKVPDAVITEGVTIAGFPIKFSELPESPALRTSAQGQDNAEVLKTALGYSDAQVEELVERGVIFALSSNRPGPTLTAESAMRFCPSSGPRG